MRLNQPLRTVSLYFSSGFFKISRNILRNQKIELLYVHIIYFEQLLLLGTNLTLSITWLNASRKLKITVFTLKFSRPVHSEFTDENLYSKQICMVRLLRMFPILIYIFLMSLQMVLRRVPLPCLLSGFHCQFIQCLKKIEYFEIDLSGLLPYFMSFNCSYFVLVTHHRHISIQK